MIALAKALQAAASRPAAPSHAEVDARLKAMEEAARTQSKAKAIDAALCLYAVEEAMGNVPARFRLQKPVTRRLTHPPIVAMLETPRLRAQAAASLLQVAQKAFSTLPGEAAVIGESTRRKAILDHVQGGKIASDLQSGLKEAIAISDKGAMQARLADVLNHFIAAAQPGGGPGEGEATGSGHAP